MIKLPYRLKKILLDVSVSAWCGVDRVQCIVSQHALYGFQGIQCRGLKNGVTVLSGSRKRLVADARIPMSLIAWFQTDFCI